MNKRSQTKIEICEKSFRSFALRQGVCGLQKNSQTKDLEVSNEHFRGHSKMTSPGQGERGLTNW